MMHRAIRKGKEQRETIYEFIAKSQVLEVALQFIFLSWGPNVEGEVPTTISKI
jgi:hypothetical protein